METQITLEQQNQLTNWVVQRDSILIEISRKNVENENLRKNIKDLSLSSKEIETRISENTGRLLELVKKEKESSKLISSEIANLQNKKTLLESSVTGLEKQISILLERKDNLLSTIETLAVLHDKVYARASVLDKVVEHVTRVNSENIADVNSMISDLKKTLKVNI